MYQEFFNNRLSIAAVDASWDKFVFKIKAYKYTPPPACLGHADTYASRGDTSILGGRGGGSDLTSSLEAKFGARSAGPSSPNTRKSLGSSVTTRCKSWEKIPILGSNLKFRGQNLGCLSPIFVEAKFGARSAGPSSPNTRKSLGSSVTTRCKSWEKIPILGSNLKFRGQNLGCLSPIFVEAKFGAPTRILETKCLQPSNMEIPPGVMLKLGFH